MIDVLTINDEIKKIADGKPVFSDPVLQERFIEFLKTEYFKNAQSMVTIQNVFEKQKVNAAKNRTLGGGDAVDFFNKLANKTVVLVSFGPSLRNNIDDVLKVNEKYIFFGVDRGIYWYEEKGLQIDYYTTCDAEAKADWIPDDMTLTNKILLAHVGANYDFVSKFQGLGGKVYWYGTNCRIGTHHELYNLHPVKCCVNGSGNIGQIQIVLALSLFNVKKALLVGYDNSWNKYYYPDQETDKQTGNEVIGIDGNPCFVNMMWYALNFYHEDYIFGVGAEHKIINCTGGGILKLPKIDSIKNY